MIMDLLSRWNSYAWPNERFADGFRYLEALNPAVEDGTTKLDGDNLYCSVQTYETKPRDGARFEAHRQYADIQILLNGKESILWTPVEGLAVVEPYVPDIEFFELIPGATDLLLRNGVFCVFFPQDAHAPCLMRNTAAKVRKAVVKVRLS
jgi:biofilm protein TabA